MVVVREQIVEVVREQLVEVVVVVVGKKEFGKVYNQVIVFVVGVKMH